MLGFCMGLSNLWRFPYLCFRWGGVLFLIPYVSALLFLGIPMSLMEVILGQKFQTGHVGIFSAIHPRLAGIGYAACFVSYIILYYYNVMIAWSLIYFASAFTNPLPWSMQRT